MKRLFKVMLAIGILVSPSVSAETKGDKETKDAAELSAQPTNQDHIFPPPVILSFRIIPNPAEHWERVVYEYSVEPRNDPSLRVTFDCNRLPIGALDLSKLLNFQSSKYEFTYVVTLKAENGLGITENTVTFIRKAEPK